MRGAWWAMTFVLVAGCMDDMGDLEVPQASLEFEGQDSGDHAKKAECEGDGRLTGSGHVTDGNLLVRVSEDGGEVLYEQDIGEGAFTIDGDGLEGGPGPWTLRALRSGNDAAGGDQFTGEYEIHLRC